MRYFLFFIITTNFIWLPCVQATTDCATQTDIPESECKTLLSLFNSTKGAGWFDVFSGGWNITNTPCRWAGITCQDGHVIAINKQNNGLNGPIPDLTALDHLETLDLTDNQLNGSILSANLPSNLQTLSLNNNQLSGAAPDLSRLSNLETLNLGDNPMTGTPILPSQLTEINLQFSETSYRINENDGILKITVNRTGSGEGTVEANYATRSGSAKAGSDFEVAKGTLTWTAGENNAKAFKITITDDMLDEGNETLIVTLRNSSDTLDTAKITIVDDDTTTDTSETSSTIEEETSSSVIEDNTSAVGDQTSSSAIEDNTSPTSIVANGTLQFAQSRYRIHENSGLLTLMVTRTGGQNGTIAINYETIEGTATNNDYVTTNGRLIWADGDNSKQSFQVPIIDDMSAKGDKTFSIALIDSNDTNIDTATVTIVDNEILVSSPAAISCPLDQSSIRGVCKLKGKTLPCDVIIAENSSISGALFECDATNKGWLSNSTIKEGATVQGGILTGYIKNEGTLADFDFRGASIIGGTLSGTIINNSPIKGWFQDVHLAPDTSISGGVLKGEIRGELEAPARLENLEIKKGAKLSGVIIGDNVQIPEDVELGEGVR